MANIGKHNPQITDGRYTPEIMWSMGRISCATASGDGKRIAYNVTYFSVEENKSHSVIRVMDSDGGNDILLTQTEADESNPQWIKGDSRLAFLSDEGGKSEIWEMNPDGSGRKKISNFAKDIDSFLFAPDSNNVLFISDVPYAYHPDDVYKDLPKTTAKMANDLMYKHWNKWQEVVPHPFYASFDGNSIGEATDILQGTRYESPLLPFGGMEELTWSSCSKKIAYSCKKKVGRAYTLSTDSDIYVYDIETKQEVNINKIPGDPDQNLGYDMNPRFSKDGKYVAWLSMEHDGYESDKNRLYLMDLSTHKKTDLTVRFDNDVSEFCWAEDSKTLYFASVWHGCTMIFSVDFEGNYKQITEGDFDYLGLSLIGDRILTLRHSLVAPEDIYIIDPKQDNSIRQLTHENDHILQQIRLGKVEGRWTKTVDGKQMMSWVLYPPDFDPDKKYPALLMCMGGPQEACSQVWSNRWNFILMAAQGYVMTMPNRRGCPGFGRKWVEEVSGDYGGLCMQDYFAAIDDLATEPYIDKDRLGCLGASFGGYSVYWLAGHHEKRFKVFFSHDGVFDIATQYLATDEMWFANWDNKGPYWDKNNPLAQRTYANSPHLFVDKWDTPIMCVHSNMDYRILVSQGQSAFAAARLRGIEAELLYFPDECHWVNKPQNSVFWNRALYKWMAKWLKE